MKLRHLAAALLATAIAIPASSALAATTNTVPSAAAQRGLIGDLITGLISADLQRAVTVAGIRQHLTALQAIATANGGNRAAGLPGYKASVDYVKQRLQRAGYQVTLQPFQFDFFLETGTPEFARVSPSPRAYTPNTDFATTLYSASTEVTGRVVPTNNIVLPPTPEPSSASGCEAADYPPETAGAIALIQRGTCPFAQKAEMAEAAGAIGVIIMNEGQPGRTEVVEGVGLGAPRPYPGVFTTFEVGNELYTQAQSGPVTVRIKVEAINEPRTTWNVIADTRFGNPNKIVTVGAHLDSVQVGPGINDNGSGTATNLEVAEQVGRRQLLLRNKVRFAFWGGEELGLLGSTHYVESLSDAEKAKILLNLNFDMLGSPNYVRFVYDGNGSDTPDAGPDGSGLIENVFLAHFARKNLATTPTAFDGRSDYGPFIENGIPAGGLFSGAENVKSEAEARIYGGTAGQPYDACYHQPCDGIANISNTALDQFSDAVANSVIVFGMRGDPVTDTAEFAASAAKRAAAAKRSPLFKGGLTIR
ncbi:M20/M25/M40 family metallo-hydrolase [Mycobacterium sp. KBS0706]|uniref:M28 family metallopeptidase n=1 Tax=Mycobacterium sp. KBS0706 TaxID=2578109 RepID=UPI00110FC234|nr:M28 family metallopeptidase [Mycobacterium sp. KBS0706]TSD84866.1 M20/M25/M40 family metallo-hydrolase [Mycobacterium sp. KBS0706]